MIRFVVIALIIFVIYAFVDCAVTPQENIRKGPKWAYLLGMFFIPLPPIAAIIWFVFGRPKKPRRGKGGPRRIIPPDDDPDFLRKL
jgi:hypothetical protein